MTVENSMAEYIASLRTQNPEANSSYVQETRAAFLGRLHARTDGAFPDEAALHVPSGLDKLVEDIATDRAGWRLVVLTGDAGDGKTQACARLAERWGLALDSVTRCGGWAVVKDASELDRDELAQLIEEWRTGQTRLLLAINEGRLRATAALFGEAWDDVLEGALDGQLDAAGAERLEVAGLSRGILVLNFRHRLFVRAGVRGLLRTWTAPGQWEAGACAACPVQDRCPILANAVELRDSERVERLADTLMWLHLAGQRLPFRRLQGVLAFAFTGGVGCAQVQATPEPRKLVRHRYWSALFLTRREQMLGTMIHPEPAAALLAALDPATESERGRDEALLAAWRDEPPEHGPEAALRTQDSSPSEILPMLRQRAILHGTAAPWREALVLLEEPQGEALLRAVVRALNRVGGHRDNASKLHPILIDPEGLASFERRTVELELPAAVELRVRRAPAVPPSACACLDDLASVVEIVGEGADPPALALDALLLEGLLRLVTQGASVVALGGYRADLARFLARVVAAGSEGASVVLRIDDQRLRVVPEGTHLRLETI